jgi:hypothetical protein
VEPRVPPGPCGRRMRNGGLGSNHSWVIAGEARGGGTYL